MESKNPILNFRIKTSNLVISQKTKSTKNANLSSMQTKTRESIDTIEHS